MRKLIIDKVMDNINNNCDFDNIKTAEIKYGIESFYLFISKTIIILFIAFILGIIKEILLLLVFYNILRTTGFGVHALKSWHCWFSSLLIFLGVPMLMKFVDIPMYAMYVISFICLLLIVKYAPADTEKRPIINLKRRKVYKVCCSITAIIYILMMVFIQIEIIQYALMYSLIIETFMILPISYKIFGAKYDNYKTYLKQVQVQ